MAPKLPLRDTVGMAIDTLRSNRMRSLLTMLGIVIGNASVISLVGVGNGARNLAEGQLSTLGANVLFVFPGTNDTRRQGIEVPKTLVLEDAPEVKVLATNKLDDQIDASPALVGDQIIMRSKTHLYCIGE